MNLFDPVPATDAAVAGDTSGAAAGAAAAGTAASGGAAADGTVAADAALPQGQSVEVGSFGQIELHVKDVPLTTVLQLLSIQSQRNIIASRNVAGSVSADLYGVGFYEALDAILHTNGFGYQEDGNFIYVYTAAELASIEQAQRKTVTEIVTLNYINAADASAFVTPLLSAAGSIAVSGQVPMGMLPSKTDAGANSFALPDTMVINDYIENVEQIKSIITALDTRPKQVLVEATILQARLDEANAFGVDFAIFGNLDVDNLTSPLAAVNDLIAGKGPNGPIGNGSAITANPGNVATGPSSIKLGVLGNDAAVFVRALDSVTDTNVLANPKILVLNRQRADLLIGEKLGYLSSTSTETSTTQTVEFLEVGTQLTVRPFASDDGFIRLEIRPSLSEGSTTSVEGTVIPNEVTQELTSNVIVRSGQTIVLGGLFKEDTTIDRTQVPGLGNIPLLGGAFRGQDDTVERSEVIFLIKPTVLKDQALYAAADRAVDSINLSLAGTRKGLLPWSRTKLTSSHLQEAHKHLRAGNEEKALWNVNMALYLEPSMIEALRLKEQITGERFYVQDRSILQNAIDSMIDTQMQDLAPVTSESTEPVSDANANANLAADAFETSPSEMDAAPAELPAELPAEELTVPAAETDTDTEAAAELPAVEAQVQSDAYSFQAGDTYELSDDAAPVAAEPADAS